MGGAISDLFSSDVSWASPIARTYTPFLAPQVGTTADGKWGEADQVLVGKLMAQQGHHGAILDVASLHSHPAMSVTYVTDKETGTTSTVSVLARQNPYEENDTIFDDLLDATSGSALTALVTELGSMGSSNVPITGLTSLDNAMTTGMAHKPEVFTTTVNGQTSNTVIDAFTRASAWLAENAVAALFTTAGSGAITQADVAVLTAETIASVPARVTAAVAGYLAADALDEAYEAARLADSFQGIRGAALGNGFDLAQAKLSADSAIRRTAASTKMYADLAGLEAQANIRQAEINVQVKASAHEAAKINISKQVAKGGLLLSEMTAKIDAAMKACSEHVSGYIQAKTATAQMSVQLGIALAEEYVRAFGFQFNWLAGKAGILEQLVKLRNLKVEHAVRAKLWNVDLIPYWQAAFGAAGAATVKKPSPFDNLSNVVGTGANAAATIVNAIGAFK